MRVQCMTDLLGESRPTAMRRGGAPRGYATTVSVSCAEPGFWPRGLSAPGSTTGKARRGLVAGAVESGVSPLSWSSRRTRPEKRKELKGRQGREDRKPEGWVASRGVPVVRRREQGRASALSHRASRWELPATRRHTPFRCLIFAPFAPFAPSVLFAFFWVLRSIASSGETVGAVRVGKVTQRVIERDLSGFEGPAPQLLSGVTSSLP